MKIRHQQDGGAVRIWVSGDLDSGQCDCLQAFWNCHIDETAAQVDIELADLDCLDGQSISALVEIVRQHLSAGAAVTVHHAPQMLAHTFYKIGLISNPRFELIAPRQEEPYG